MIPAPRLPISLFDAAALNFEPLAVDPPNRARFTEQAAAFVCIGAAMLTKDPTELAAALKAQGEAGIFTMLEEVNETREWFAGFVKLLDAVEARMLISASRVAMEA